MLADMDTVNKKLKLPNIRKKFSHVAKVKIPAASGKSDGHKHIDFWMFDTFDPIKSIQEVKACNGSP